MASESDFDYIIEPLREHAVPVDELNVDSANANTHPQRNLQAIIDSMREFGQRQVILAREDTNTVIAGNGRLMAARDLGWSHIACVFVDDDEVTALRYAIADNRTAELSEWDEEVLQQVLTTIEDEHGSLEATGFDDAAVAELVGEVAAGDVDPNEEWEGMPDFEQEDQTAYQTIKVHFECEEDVQEFARLVDQNITEKTKYIWFPEREYETFADKAWVGGEEYDVE